MFAPRRRTDPELLDLPLEAQDERQLSGSLMDIRQVNLRLGGINSALRDLDLVLRRREVKRKSGAEWQINEVKNSTKWGLKYKNEAGRDLRILDVAAGSADVTAAMARHAGKMGFKVLAVAADLNLSVLGQGRAWNREFHEISYALANGLSLPFPDDSFDIVHCSLVLHHLSEEDALRFLKEMARVSRFAVIAGDLRRNLIPWALIWIISRLFTSNKYTRYDGPLSVRRSFTPGEMKRLAQASGLKEFMVRRRHFWRMSLVGFI
ncbi:MAG: methyltransferase domain-containing protein [Nitrospirota bacterium]